MYIEVRKSAFYLKSSSWDKATKKTVSKSVYLGSDFSSAQVALEELVTPDSPVLGELAEAAEGYATARAQAAINKVLGEISNETKTAKDLGKLLEKLTKAQEKREQKAQEKQPKKSQFKGDSLAHENLSELEERGQMKLTD